jgi:hypothetical protein
MHSCFYTSSFSLSKHYSLPFFTFKVRDGLSIITVGQVVTRLLLGCSSNKLPVTIRDFSGRCTCDGSMLAPDLIDFIGRFLQHPPGLGIA